MFADLLRAKLAGICELSDAQIERLRVHHDLLMRWNKVLSLTSVHNLEETVERHYCESVFAAIHLPPGPLSLADLGSGAGFPGIPVAVLRSDCAIALIESHQRKAAFLKEATRDLANVRVIAKRAEGVEERFEWVLSRAVRYADIARTIKKLGNNAELLTGEVQPEDLPGFKWLSPIRLPWGLRRFLWLSCNAGH